MLLLLLMQLLQKAKMPKSAQVRPARRPKARNGRKRINLALQGGGAHGAFTWGALDQLLEDGRFDIRGISATNVHTGEVRIFTREEITAEAITASACLPLVFRAVEIDGVSYWDGGYSGNPALIPFLRATAAEDVLIVQINPRERRKTPTRTREILSRLNEINFNASLLSELRAVRFVNRLVDEGRLPRGMGEREFRRLRLHRILMEEMGETPSTLTTDYQTFEMLRKLGQRATRRSLDS